MRKINALLIKYKEFLLYVICGFGTTAINFLSFSLFQLLLGENLYLLSNGFAWILAVLFAYVANKLWIFESKSWQPAVLQHEIPTFLGARTLSFVIEEVGLFLMVDLLKFDTISLQIGGFNLSGSLIAKLTLAVIVIILNYLFSKLVIFKKK